MNTVTIISAENRALKEARKLKERTGRRKAGGLFLVEGRKLIGEAVAAGLEIDRLYVREGDAQAQTDAAELIGVSEDGAPRVYMLTEHLFAGLTETMAPQPLVAVVKIPGGSVGLADMLKLASQQAGGKEVAQLGLMVMDRIGDPGNAGTVVRTALAAGMDGVIALKGTADLLSGKALRSSAGSVFHLPAAEGVGEEELIETLASAGAELTLLSADGQDLYEAELAGGCALVVGNEANGPSAALRQAATRTLAIPMNEKSESLNAGVAAAVVMFERMRQEVRRR
jgi:TrmH family RNA methyltransferase